MKSIGVRALGLALLALMWIAPATRGAAGGAATRPRASVMVATVGGTGISRAEYEREAARALAEFEQRRGPASETVRQLIRRQALDMLVRQRMLALEARRKAVPVDDADVEEQFKKHPFFNQNGQFDAERYAKVKAANSPEYRATLAEIRATLGSQILAQRLEKEVEPDLQELRSEAERRLSHATLDALALRFSDFEGDTHEPREREILDYYQTHLKDFAHLDRAELSVIHVGSAPNGLAHVSADSLIRALKAGARFDVQPGIETRVLVTGDGFPSYWRGDAATRATVFKAAPGTVLDKAVPGTDGWLVVRVDAVHPGGVPPLRDVAREIRRVLRESSHYHNQESALRAEYQSRRTMLRTNAYKLRYAVVDSSDVRVGAPSAADLDSYYKGHLADFSAYDAKAASIRTRPLDEVRDEVVAGWTSEQKIEQARAVAEQVEEAWRQGRRDRAAETVARVIEIGPVAAGLRFGGGEEGRAVSDSLEQRAGRLGTGVATLSGGGTLIFDIYQQVKDYIPTFEEYRGTLEHEAEQNRQDEEERSARALFDKDPSRWGGGRVIHFHEVLVPFRDVLQVPLSRNEVERYHLEHLDEYSAPEQVRARHILLSPKDGSPEADAQARERAEQVLAKVRAGEDFAELAKRYTDDDATREQGGDLGFFARGVMLDAVERSAFALKPGQTSGVVKSEVGYHIIQVMERQPLAAAPLSHIYTNVGYDAAVAKANRLAQATADSLLRVARTPAALQAAARKLGLNILDRQVVPNDFLRMPPDFAAFLNDMNHLKPGQVVPRTRSLKGSGVYVAWFDSVGSGRASWDDVKQTALAEYRKSVTRGLLEAKRAELDSMAAAGWSVDSLAALWGGYEHLEDTKPGLGIPGLGGVAQVDSLVFGGVRPPLLAVNAISEWIALDRGEARLKVAKRIPPKPELVAARVESRRWIMVQRGLQDYFTRLAVTYPVKILDPELRDTSLPPLPEDVP